MPAFDSDIERLACITEEEEEASNEMWEKVLLERDLQHVQNVQRSKHVYIFSNILPFCHSLKVFAYWSVTIRSIKN